MTVNVVIKNTGKSVATEGAITALPIPNFPTAILVKKWRKPCEMPDEFKAGSVQSREVFGGSGRMDSYVTPGESVSQHMGIVSSDVTYANSQQGYWFLGCLTYKDQFGKQHHTTFCFQPAGPGDNPHPEIPKFKICNAFQEAN